MISNTKLLYAKAKAFQDKRAMLNDEYTNKLEALKKYEGSEGYQEDLEALNNKHENDLKSLIDEYRPGFQTVIGGMMEAIGKRSVSAPSADMVNLLSVLKMKRNVTLEECQRTAEAVKDNPLAVSVVSEIAKDHGIMQSFDHLCPEMSSQRASNIVTNLKSWSEDFLQYSTTRSSRIAERFYNANYGKTDIKLTERRLFTDETDFYRELGLEGDMMEQFSEIVDA